MLYLHTKHSLPSSNGSLATVSKPEDKETFAQSVTASSENDGISVADSTEVHGTSVL
jgi:hypothetical protein